MDHVYTNKRVNSEDETAKSNSEKSSSGSSDVFFDSACSNCIDCAYCEELRWQRQHKLQHHSASPASSSFHTATDNVYDSSRMPRRAVRTNVYNMPYYGAVDTTVPLLTAAGEVDSESDSLGHADLSSTAVLSTLRKLQGQKKPEKKKQSSLVTIFSVWNTTMGSSLLAMAWGVERAGLVPALALLVLMGGLCLYTAYLLLTVNRYHGGDTCEVPALCRILLGSWAEGIAHLFSLLVLIGANIVYWILITNFLYFTVNYFVDLYTDQDVVHNTTLYCTQDVNTSLITPGVSSDDTPGLWGIRTTVPLVVALIVFPLLNFNSATFFTKFNSLGTLSVIYLMIFVSTKLASWGLHTSPLLDSPRRWQDAAALSGMLALSFYIHNIIITIMNNNQRQENNGRDLTLAFVLITLTYTLVGAGFYICFPLLKNCIADNILNNFEMHDVMTAVARILLLFQVVTVYPLIAFMLREEAILLMPLRKQVKKKKILTVAVNAVTVIICILFACFCPNIGTIIRYTGAVSGLVHIFALPSLLYVRSLKIRGELTIMKKIIFSTIISLGVINFVMQFFISE